ncbi:MAG: hypothetical protein H7039_02825 [Bryobacteraceae bacterium]|nr:hypothetical protein [Bryobacteraceae bacterium]
MAFFTFSATGQTVPLDLASEGSLQLLRVKASAMQYRGKSAVQLTEASAPKAPGPDDPGLLAIVRDSNFEDGIIELEIAGKPTSSASQAARGFVGVAFRVQGDGARFEYIYIRPTNGRAEDQVRRNHSVQYSSHPDFPWFRLRKEEPEKYESYADLEPGEWTKVKVVVSGTKARLYLHGASQPALIVNDLKLGGGRGRIALWLGPEAEGYFADLRITRGAGQN